MIGIYKIINLINGDFYIGQSVNIERRMIEHKTPKNILNGNLAISKAIKLYGKENFTFEIVEECKLEELDAKEMYYIAKLQPFYNRDMGGKGSTGHIVTDDVKKILSELSKKQWENKSEYEKNLIIENNLKGPSLGHYVSNETKEKIKNKLLGRKQSNETIEKRKRAINETLKNKKKIGKRRVYKIDCDTMEILNEYESITRASIENGVNVSSIYESLKNEKRRCKGYYWRYVE